MGRMGGQQPDEADGIALRRPVSSATSLRLACLLLSCLLFHSADAFVLPHLAPWSGSPRSHATQSGIGGARALGKQIRTPAGRLALRMGGEEGEDLGILLKQKERLLLEQGELLKQQRDLSKRVAPPAAAAAKQEAAEEERPFEKRDMWGNAIKDAAKAPIKMPKQDMWGNTVSEKKETDPSKVPRFAYGSKTEGTPTPKVGAGGGGKAEEPKSRRSILQTLVRGAGFSVLTLVVIALISFPRLEKVAFLNFSLLFFDGALAFSNKLLQAINGSDWATVAELTKEGGVLEEGVLQPMLFWAAGGAGDVEFSARIAEVIAYTTEGLKSLHTIALSKPASNAPALSQWKGMKEQINSFARMANERMPDELAPLGEIK